VCVCVCVCVLKTGTCLYFTLRGLSDAIVQVTKCYQKVTAGNSTLQTSFLYTKCIPIFVKYILTKQPIICIFKGRDYAKRIRIYRLQGIFECLLR